MGILITADVMLVSAKPSRTLISFAVDSTVVHGPLELSRGSEDESFRRLERATGQFDGVA